MADISQVKVPNVETPYDIKARNIEKNDSTSDFVHNVVGELITTQSATITDGIAQFMTIEANPLKGLKADITPIQDLHGYDNPWVGGAGKNKVDVADQVDITSATMSLANIDEFKGNTLTASADVQAYGSGGTCRIRLQYVLDGTTIYSLNTNIVSGKSVATLEIPNDATTVRIYAQRNGSATSYDVKNIQLEIGSTATDFAPYKNICPIYGHTQEKITVSPVNITTLYNGQINSDGGYTTLYASARVCNVNQRRMNEYFLPKGTYTIAFDKLDDTATDLLQCSVLTKDGEFNIIDNFANFWNALPFTFTTTADGYLYFTARKDANTNLTPSNYKAKIIRNTYTIDLNGTRYGTTFEIDKDGNVKLTVDKGYIIYNGSENWGVSSGRFRLSKPSDAPNLLDVEDGALSNLFGYSTSTTTADNEFYIGTNYISVRCDSCEDLTAFTTLLTNNNMQVAYELATPTTVTLTPTQITALLGENNVSASTGAVSECKYTKMHTWDDIKAYIDAKIAE